LKYFLVAAQHPALPLALIVLAAAGNLVLRDIAALLRARLLSHFSHTVYVAVIDPTPCIRACVCNGQDHIYCVVLAQSAVDAAFSGFSGCLVGQVNTHCG